MCSRAFSGNRCLLKRLGWRQWGFVRSHAKSTANDDAGLLVRFERLLPAGCT
jgi:hypothetical protein